MKSRREQDFWNILEGIAALILIGLGLASARSGGWIITIIGAVLIYHATSDTYDQDKE